MRAAVVLVSCILMAEQATPPHRLPGGGRRQVRHDSRPRHHSLRRTAAPRSRRRQQRKRHAAYGRTDTRSELNRERTGRFPHAYRIARGISQHFNTVNAGHARQAATSKSRLAKLWRASSSHSLPAPCSPAPSRTMSGMSTKACASKPSSIVTSAAGAWRCRRPQRRQTTSGNTASAGWRPGNLLSARIQCGHLGRRQRAGHVRLRPHLFPRCHRSGSDTARATSASARRWSTSTSNATGPPATITGGLQIANGDRMGDSRCRCTRDSRRGRRFVCTEGLADKRHAPDERHLHVPHCSAGEYVVSSGGSAELSSESVTVADGETKSVTLAARKPAPVGHDRH